MTAEMLQNRLLECGLPASDSLTSSLLVYHTMLMDWNTRMDLTAVLT